MQEPASESDRGTTIDPLYSSGTYFSDASRHREDAEFKAANFVKVLLPFVKRSHVVITSYADVGCGAGLAAKIVADTLRKEGFGLVSASGYDVSPHVQDIRHEGVEYVYADFCEEGEAADLVTLFDVFEHVLDPVGFLKRVARKAKVIGLHIPLDHSVNAAARNLFREKLRNPGHLVFLDAAGALNLLALSGLRVVDYEYTLGFLAPSGHKSLLQKLVFPFRLVLAKISPWLLSKTIGGAGLLVIALTPRGLQEQRSSTPPVLPPVGAGGYHGAVPARP